MAEQHLVRIDWTLTPGQARLVGDMWGVFCAFVLGQKQAITDEHRAKMFANVVELEQRGELIPMKRRLDLFEQQLFEEAIGGLEAPQEQG